jgi:hypothetical protein
MSVQEQLPDLFNQAQDTPSSSEFDSNLDSFVDLDFENSEFENFKLKKSTSLPILIISNTSQLCNMESDCKEEGISTVPGSSSSSSNDEILKILTAISSQMVVGHQDLQNQLISNNHQLKEELQHVKEENEKFRQEICAEISTSSSVPPMPTPTVPPVVSTPVPLITMGPSSGSMSQVTNSADFQNQMLAVLNDTFSKLSSVISDTSTILQDTKTAISESKSSETKSEWVKFSGDPKKFRQWYLSVMAQLSIAPWQSLYDSSTNSVVTTTVNSALNGKLYAKVIGALEGSALQHMLARKHLRANGTLLLQELHQMYKPKCVPEVIASKTVEFWGHTKRLSSESVDEYYNRFQELLEEINEEVVTIPTQNAIRHCIFTLGDEFQPLQNNFRLGTISEDWKTQDWPSLLVLCRDFYNSVNPKGPTAKRDRVQDRDPFTELCIDRNTHHKKIRMWLMNPIKHKSDIDSEQSKFPGRCLYHLSKTHSTVDCNVTKECNKLIASKRNASASNGSNSSGTSSTTGNLRHITEEVYEDAIDAVDPKDESNVHSDNDTNETDLLYFARVSKHYLRLVKNNSLTQDPSRHIMKYPIIIDSGANFHMFRDREFFTTLTPATGKVILGDGVTSLPILGVGTVQCIIGSHTLTIENVRYIPTLSESVYSLFIHVQQVNHSIHSSFDQGLFLQFPEFQTKAIIGHNDLYLDAIPTINHLLHQSFPDPIANL